MAKLNATAKAMLREAGISQAAWARANYMRDGKWCGDACGCADDRCIGYHHDADDDCGCLPATIGLYFEWLRGAPYSFDEEAPEYVNRVVIEDRRTPAPGRKPQEGGSDG